MRAILLLLLLSPLLAMSQETAVPAYKIYDTRIDQEVDLQAILVAARDADVLFFGEEHTDSVGHALELAIYKGLAAQAVPPVLSLEMFETDVQGILDEYLQGIIKESHLQKDARAWNNYKDYRPLVEYAREHGLAVLAANAPARYTSVATRKGLSAVTAMHEGAKRCLAPLPIDTATGRYYEKFSEVMGTHSAMSGLHLFQAQSLWDATMAWSVFCYLQAHAGARILHLNGRFHSDEKLGIVPRLLAYAQQAGRSLKVLNISCFPDASFTAPTWEQFRQLGDYVIITRP